MNVRVLSIRLPADIGPQSRFSVDVELAVNGRTGSYEFNVEPASILGPDYRVVSPGDAATALFQEHQYVVGRVCQLVSQAIRSGPVKLPQLVAA
jgi:hypothetical protein